MLDLENRLTYFDAENIFKEKFNDKLTELNVTTINRSFFAVKNKSLEHCFTFDVLIEEERWKSLLSLTSLVINLTNFDYIYLEQFNKSFTTKSLKLDQTTSIVKVDDQSLNCKNYIKKKDGCDSKDNCIGKSIFNL